MVVMSVQTRRLRILLGCGVGSVSVVALFATRKALKKMLREQKKLAGGSSEDAKKLKSKKDRVDLNGDFVKRLKTILAICVPKLMSREGYILCLQSLCLLCRTLLTDLMANVEGECAEAITTMNWPGFGRAIVKFAIISAPASIVNAGLKMLQALAGLAFRWRLSHYLHTKYMTNRAYYDANVLSRLTNADQRITEDVEKFCTLFAELFSYTFKPILDIIIFTRSISKVIGWRGQALLYSYFILCSIFLKGISPPLGLMTAQESALSGNLRAAHARVKANAEEIAFNDPPSGFAERRALDSDLKKLLRHMTLSSFQRFVQSCADGYFVKYTASIIGLSIFALPFYLDPNRFGGKNLTNEYIKTIKLMMNTSAAIGQLVLAYKRILQLAGHTSRVSELLEQVHQMSTSKTKSFAHVAAANGTKDVAEGDDAVVADISGGEPSFVDGDLINFEGVTIRTPDGTELVHDISFKAERGTSVIILGPNGSGKSSLLRVLAQLWPLERGNITRPKRGEIYFLSQRPYMYAGTLRENLLYPKLLRKAEDAELMECMTKVGVGYLQERHGWDQEQNWMELLSGGERQLLAMARLLFHKPKFAVLDECTSALSADKEQKMYEVCTEAGITMLSIAHRPAVLKYHQESVVFDGNGSWEVKKLVHDEAV